MPFAKRQGAVSSVLIAALSMILYDLVTSGFTQWTVVTTVTYSLIALVAPLFLRPSRGLLWYAGYAIVATIFYDAVTGVAAGAVLFGMSWKQGFIGQIPFTINHLIGNVLLSVSLSPLLEWMLAKSERWNPAALRVVTGVEK
jgi:hypothetical protein